MTRLETDVAIIGAGAAGLAAAQRLRERSVKAIVIEARDRVGGRAYTIQSQGNSAPIELGAEYIHGAPHSTLSLMQACGESIMDVAPHAFQLRNGRLEEASNLWESADRLLQRVDVRAPDQSVQAFLDTVPRDQVSGDELEAVRTLVEGFEAAVTTDASVIAIANEWRNGSSRVNFRPVNGYAPLMQCIARIADTRILLQTRVDEIRWSRQGVRIAATAADGALQIRARRAIVTLPIGVLRENHVAFTPPLPSDKQAAIDAIVMGPVIKVILDFRSPFWERVEDGRYRDAGFFYAPQCKLPALWARWPQRTSFLAAWCGGGAVQRLIENGLAPTDAALETCATLFPSIDVRAELRDVYHHDWQADPFACGAYSYVRVGGAGARDALATPIEATLFFAGEATSNDDPGTVAGAFDSGYRAADEITDSESGLQPGT